MSMEDGGLCSCPKKCVNVINS